MTINDVETSCKEIYLFLHLLVQNVQFPSQLRGLCYLHLPVVAFSSANGQSAPPVPPFCSSIKSDRELWDEWDWATSANTASEFVAIVGVVEVLGFYMLTSILVLFVMSSLVPKPLGDCNLGLLCFC